MAEQNEGVGARIRAARRGHKSLSTQPALADAIGIRRENISHWETGKAMPSGENLVALARALGVTPEWILHGEESQPTLGIVRESGAQFGTSRATPILDMLSRSAEMRRFSGHIGIGSRVAMALDYAQRGGWNRAELLETFERVREWAEEAERTINDLYHQLRDRGGPSDPDKGAGLHHSPDDDG